MSRTKFEQVKQCYDRGLWDVKRVHDAVGKNWITETEYEQIVGNKYEDYVDPEEGGEVNAE